MEDFIRSGNSGLSNAEQTNVYNNMMYDFFKTIRSRISKGQQPMRVSEGNKVWQNYRNLYVDPSDSQLYEEHCRKAIKVYTEKIPTGFGSKKES
jgi:predicted DNA-binding protein (UPF0278 family)